MSQTIETSSSSPVLEPQAAVPASISPLMQQYGELKNKAGDALLFFRMGDFYELFGEDAVEAAQLLEITLTSRDKGKANPIPMAGVPHHSSHAYVQRLLKAGRKVAIAEQMEDPATVKGPKAIVKRDIVRTFTPAVHFEQEGSEAQYLATALPESASSGKTWTLALLEPSTGEVLWASALSTDELLRETQERPIKHFLRIGHQLPEELSSQITATPGVLFEDLPQNILLPEQAKELLTRNYEVGSLDAYFAQEQGGGCPEAIHSLGILLRYVLRTQNLEKLTHIQIPAPLRTPSSLRYGPRTPQHLDVFPNADGTPSLFGFLNRTRTAMGARQLKRWLSEPLIQVSEIEKRQAAIRTLGEHDSRLSRVGAALSGIYDLERLMGRIEAHLANPRDTLAIGKSIDQLGPILTELATLAQAAALDRTSLLEEHRLELAQSAADLRTLSDRILTSQKEDAPLITRDGGIFNKGTHAELDRLLSLSEDGSRWLIELETRERESTGIPTLKVRYNKVFGYYIEVTQSHLARVPTHYQRKQTTVGAERFFTEELKKFEDDFVHAAAKQKALEQVLFEELLCAIQEQARRILTVARTLAQLDALTSLARVSQEPGWCFPQLDDSCTLEIQAGRHPLVDQSLRGRFVPNDLQLSPDSRLTLVITGPNMGGKSTVMRQTALIVILGQMGCAVPAASARWGVFSSIFTRIGAQDAISRGQSTFMVEMSELAQILHHADDRSLIVLDEIGRGTSTFDGISVAWATLEWLVSEIKARTLFATHYHELTTLTNTLPHAANAHMAVESSRAGAATTRQHLRFLYLLKEGAASESFGVQVAALAGLPKAVIQRAWKVLEELESDPAHNASSKKGKKSLVGERHQLELFSSFNSGSPASATSGATSSEAPPSPPSFEALLQEQPSYAQLNRLEELNLNETTPLQALVTLSELQKAWRELRSSFS